MTDIPVLPRTDISVSPHPFHVLTTHEQARHIRELIFNPALGGLIDEMVRRASYRAVNESTAEKREEARHQALAVEEVRQAIVQRATELLDNLDPWE